MKNYFIQFISLNLLAFVLCSCASNPSYTNGYYYGNGNYSNDPNNSSNHSSSRNSKSKHVNYGTRLPQTITTKEKVIVVDPKVHAWGAYSNGKLVRAGVATAGDDWCPDIKRPCRTKAGSFRIKSLGSARCKSSMYPLPRGGAPMPYCMFFNGHQGLHGSYNVVEGNVSHGCVRMRVDDAAWVRFNFARVGTKVIVKPYSR